MARGRSSPLLKAVAAAAGLSALAQFLGAAGFVGGASLRGSRAESAVVRGVGVDYLLRNGPKNADPPLVEPSEAKGATVNIEFKKRPFGVARYAPGKSGKGAVVMEVKQQSRYPGDPLGQAFVAGVKPNWVVKSVNGQDATGMVFEDIMEMLDDEVLDPVAAMSLNLKRAGVGTDFADQSFKADKKYGEAGTYKGAAAATVAKAELPIKIVYQEI